jgi:hypothetical protein
VFTRAPVEAGFLDCSYGFRPGRNAHHALQALRLQIVSKKVNHVFEADMRRRASGRSGAASSCAGHDWIRSICSASGGPNEECGDDCLV